MHPKFSKADASSGEVIGAAIEVHRHKRPGLIASIHKRCRRRELELRKRATVRQRVVRIEYKGMIVEEPPQFEVRVRGGHRPLLQGANQ